MAAVGFSVFYLTNWTIGPLLMMGPPAILAFLWNCVDFLCLSVVNDRQGVHPIACIIVDGLLFLGLGAMSGVIAFTLSKLDDSGYYFAFFQDEAGEEYLRIVLGFGILAAVLHLAMSILACFEIKQRRAADARSTSHHIDCGGLTSQQPQAAAPLLSDPPPAYSLSSNQASRSEENYQVVVPGMAVDLSPSLGKRVP
ncbi:predicted protein [Verticillium alfalfae VaMs.102]|uniref:Predicted protein n=1 Tax=Verticillium alfalfae (strain VaMs.102 / ATCC MYA-4576 / FGSC 10136) TaxID=526221 RepID=C9SUZ8_VERA1|nr:predicted protein [Verticillium alfalfae VaMs.102]EEY22613.1 predicted protein [Verticillium alfalfae VaMs.102]